MIDLRSDTITRPTGEMLEAMLQAEVGDDVLGDDPSVNSLQELAAGMFEVEAALFCPSGTMTNQIAINVHTRPGEEVICHKSSHVYYYEGGAMMKNSGVSVCLLEGEKGLIDPDDIELHINPDDDHRPVTSLVEVENTTNKGGGARYPFETLKKISAICRSNNLKLHLDGARLFNAIVEGKETLANYGELFDSISICLSKGLGAPVGSILLGKSDFIRQAKRVRKTFGGAMRQAGYLAAAGKYALENNIDRLKDDNHRAKDLEIILSRHSLVRSITPTESNILIFKLSNKIKSDEFLSRLKSFNILALALDHETIRLVTNLHFTDNNLDEFERAIKQI